MKTPVLLALVTPLLIGAPVLAQTSPDQPLRCTPRPPHVTGGGQLVTTDTMLCRPIGEGPQRPDWRFEGPRRDWRAQPILRRPFNLPSPYDRQNQQ
ncbi:hypothetical protein [Gloeobacter kilaueensis]|uniref:Uncharacterized protein n=1 Tax=Gloeobacter kilaueensis (strain ATCC BAA-2537 / CCAP 1431/1 / ULC 316 / JS1) TaxID=1183438 RepID=U5QJG9_GLOK1|nr:hypothetical protein [Gloeobacter kilaueensis]AGY57769.1 hypothetical protein GKIL_1523 [Gloeobacter kilaueensis JS1]